ncbi:MAG: shikimate dehydrogenase [Actinobacteria bacterium]|nr:shikimate dehydrogenase [Actinomycetota bacterium]
MAAVIGDPIRHSLSPLILNAAFRARELDWVYVAFPVEEGNAREALVAMRTFAIDGLSVTMPHKTAVAGAIERCTEVAAALRAVNCVVRTDDGELVGHNTDGSGFLSGIAEETGFAPAGQRCVIVGAGGAARAVAVALARAGAADVAIVNRTRANAEQAAVLAVPVGRVGASDDIERADLVVNATSVGMARREPAGLPFDPDRLHQGQILADLIYDPLTTPLLSAARTRGAITVNGVGMLVHQAAAAFELWTGVEAPIAAMTSALGAHLRQRG